jgi:polyisoprenoid-binding protein YceI
MKTVFTAFVFVASLTAFASNKLTLNVELSPAGSFQAITDKVKGDILKQKDGTITAEKLSVNIKSMKTGIDLRNEHFWKHLNAEDHPKVTLYDFKGKDGKASGKLEVAGTKRPIEITYSEQGGSINAKFKVNSSAYKLPKAQYLGVGVEDVVQGEVTLPFKTI